MAAQKIDTDKIVTLSRDCGGTAPSSMHVVVVGAGGIGARYVPLLVKMLRRGDQITIVDPDRVEERNLLRQHFCAADVGRYKAEVLASRYSTETLPIRAVAAPIAEQLWGSGAIYTEAPITLFVGAVDSKAARQAILNIVKAGYGQLYIDGGNERTTGQVVWGSFHRMRTWRVGLSPNQDHYCGVFLDPYETMSSLFQGEESTTPGCGVRFDPQTPMINNMVAAVMANLTAHFLFAWPLAAAGWRVSVANGITPLPIQEVQPVNRYGSYDSDYYINPVRQN